jgi:hypothetical protein
MGWEPEHIYVHYCIRTSRLCEIPCTVLVNPVTLPRSRFGFHGQNKALHKPRYVTVARPGIMRSARPSNPWASVLLSYHALLPREDRTIFRPRTTLHPDYSYTRPTVCPITNPNAIAYARAEISPHSPPPSPILSYPTPPYPNQLLFFRASFRAAVHCSLQSRYAWKKSLHISRSPPLRFRHRMLLVAASWHGSKYSL